MSDTYDAIVLVSFGGPEGMDDVMPFLDNVLRGRNVPDERKKEVAHHYELFGGVSPINEQNRRLMAALKEELRTFGPDLPVYWGNRNWHPMLADTVRQMADDGVRRALAFVTAAYGSYSSCRQYQEDIARARAEVGERAPVIDKLRVFYNHPGFVDPNVENVRAALDSIPPERRAFAHIVFTAHSIPVSMAEQSDYARQLEEISSLIAQRLEHLNCKLAYQSRSGPASQPWLEPDVCDYLKELQAEGVKDVVVAPIGFVSDHMEVIYDIDTEAKKLADELGINLVRASTVGSHPRFVQMIRELIDERIVDGFPRLFVGEEGAPCDACRPDCCPAPVRPAAASKGAGAG